ncbi:MAG TPA: toll/interleukin-1 receptor domain-containing protein [Chloroflexota bacterium]|nr:toll/interleukin-1 receptor domain-containing protein [Chloroflexota bacterium]
MATIREYFDADFSYTARLHVKLPDYRSDVEVTLLYDFAAFIAFVACYVPGDQYPLQEFLQLIEAMQPGKSQVTVNFNDKVTLPDTRAFPGLLEVRNTNPFGLRAKFYGDPEWICTDEIQTSTRVFIYTESRLTDNQISQLKQRGRDLEVRVQFRSIDHAEERSRNEKPLAFICHDSRDKVDIARPIALGLSKMLCPVWYDEYSLKVGDSLRKNIEKGLKECKKCVLIISQNFLNNSGWSKTEFDSVFTRQILEGSDVVLPVWCGVTKQQVYDYSPSLLDRVAVSWDEGIDDVLRKLYRAIE